MNDIIKQAMIDGNTVNLAYTVRAMMDVNRILKQENGDNLELVNVVFEDDLTTLDSFAKVRTMNAAKRTMIDAIRSDLENRFVGQPMRIDVAHTNNKEAALEFAKELEAEFPEYQIHRIDELSLSVACHIGDGSLAVACSRIVEV